MNGTPANLKELHDACDDGNLPCVIKLHLDRRADYDALDGDKQCALHHAVQGCEVELVKYVAVRGHSSLVNAKDVFGMTPFHLACENGDLGIVEYLCTLEGFDKRLRRSSASFIAARHQHAGVVDYLMKCDPELRENNRRNSFHKQKEQLQQELKKARRPAGSRLQNVGEPTKQKNSQKNAMSCVIA
mmetsp:Transcript_25542/g.42776  ORF Transcript_25542/g.42776 Transcript_25542/m.42776 type:complete len:187 (+) Transcript_25542:474-1034(+)|eukprot:CAMPEP_0198211198 /NCGR_PEP_ID=MMETSP1445-20131203/22680_1 /TAXON_ID=36898 /ORGANISM="Pyramimonas sp., Strain CCMP2087" /LENGTH=186 /DNA_ID=CAMNT_0043885411 /DNA_START=470 /DNA_END=1030 /DNA_ORIENTATION=-